MRLCGREVIFFKTKALNQNSDSYNLVGRVKGNPNAAESSELLTQIESIGFACSTFPEKSGNSVALEHTPLILAICMFADVALCRCNISNIRKGLISFGHAVVSLVCIRCVRPVNQQYRHAHNFNIFV